MEQDEIISDNEVVSIKMIPVRPVSVKEAGGLLNNTVARMIEQVNQIRVDIALITKQYEKNSMTCVEPRSDPLNWIAERR